MRKGPRKLWGRASNESGNTKQLLAFAITKQKLASADHEAEAGDRDHEAEVGDRGSRRPRRGWQLQSQRSCRS